MMQRIFFASILIGALVAGARVHAGALPAETATAAAEVDDARAALPHDPADQGPGASVLGPIRVSAPRLAREATGAADKALGDFWVRFEGERSRQPLPGTGLAVGTGEVVQVARSRFRAFDRAGGATGVGGSFQDLFDPLLFGTPELGNPRVVYSREHDRYLMMVPGWQSGNCFFLLAVSAVARADEWSLYRFDDGLARCRVADSAIGVDTWGVYLTAHLVEDANGAHRDSILWSFDAGLLDGIASAGWVFRDLRWPDGERVRRLRPAAPHTISSEQTTFFVNSESSGGNQVVLWRLGGDRGDAPTLTRAAIDVMAYSRAADVDQPGSEVDVRIEDARVQNAVYAFRRVYLVLTTGVSSLADGTGILSLKLNTDSNAVVTQELLHGGEGTHYFLPALTVLGGDGQLLNTGVFMNVIDRDGTFPSAAAYVFDVDGPGRFRTVRLGNEPYVNAGERWGDSNGAAYDWANPGIMWGAVLYADSNVDGALATRIAAVAMDGRPLPPPPSPSPPPPPPGGGCQIDGDTSCLIGGRFRLEVSWRDFDNRTGRGRIVPGAADSSVLFWYFDPGNWELLAKMVDGCGFNQRFWFFGAATTNVEYTITLTDTRTDAVRTYTNRLGTPSPAIIDTNAFVCP